MFESGKCQGEGIESFRKLPDRDLQRMKTMLEDAFAQTKEIEARKPKFPESIQASHGDKEENEDYEDQDHIAVARRRSQSHLNQINMEIERRKREGIKVDDPREGLNKEEGRQEVIIHMASLSDSELADERVKIVEQIEEVEVEIEKIKENLKTESRIGVVEMHNADLMKLSWIFETFNMCLGIVDEELQRR